MPSSLRQKLQRRECLLPYRYITSILLCLGSALMFLMFRSVGRAAKQLVVTPHPLGNDSFGYSIRCKFYRNVTTVVKVGDAVYDWDPASSNTIWAAHNWGYLVAIIPTGVCADLYGGKYIFCVPVMALGVLQVVGPHVLTGRGDLDFYVLFVWRFAGGVAFAMVFSSMNSILAHWTPAKERGRLSCVAYCAIQVAVTIDYGATESLMVLANVWHVPFYLYSFLVVIWSGLFVVFGFSSYHKDNKWLTRKERDYLERELGSFISLQKKKIPWFRILTSIPLWALVVAHFGHIWIWDVMAKYLPFYLQNVAFFEYYQTNRICALVYLSMGTFTVLNGYIADFLTNRDYVNLTTLRRVFTTFGAMGPAVFLLSAIYSGCHWGTTIFLFVLGMTFMSCYYGGTRINSLELAPNFSGTVMSCMTIFDVIPGFVLPIIEDIVAPGRFVGEYQLLFWIHLAVLSFTNLVYNIFGTADMQSWNNVGSREDETDSESNDSPTNLNK